MLTAKLKFQVSLVCYLSRCSHNQSPGKEYKDYSSAKEQPHDMGKQNILSELLEEREELWFAVLLPYVTLNVNVHTCKKIHVVFLTSDLELNSV